MTGDRYAVMHFDYFWRLVCLDCQVPDGGNPQVIASGNLSVVDVDGYLNAAVRHELEEHFRLEAVK